MQLGRILPLIAVVSFSACSRDEGKAPETQVAKAPEPVAARPTETADRDVVVSSSRPESKGTNSTNLLPCEASVMADPPLPPFIWKRTHEFNRQHRAILERVTLTEAQKRHIHQKFEQFCQSIRENRLLSRRDGIIRPVLTDEERSRLDGELAEAQAAGNSELASTILKQILQGTLGAEENRLPTIDEQIIEIGNDLEPDQREAFQAAVKRQQGLEWEGAFDVHFMTFIRASKDPDLAPSREQQEKLNQVIEELFTEFRANMPPVRRSREMAEKAKAAVFPILTETQRQHIERLVAEMEEQNARFDQYKRDWQKTRSQAGELGHPPPIQIPLDVD